jgi:deoxyribonuclease-4
MPVAAHASYLINLAETEPVKAARAAGAFVRELERAALLGIRLLAVHVGAHLGRGVEAGLRSVVSNLDQALDGFAASSQSPLLPGFEPVPVTVLLETTAGQGTGLGSTFEELAQIIEASRFGPNLGVCFDICHTFAAGYDCRTEEGYAKTFSRFDELMGLERLKLFHLNDSKRGPGSRIDRHEHIGKGEIGLDAFRRLLNDPRFGEIPMVLETPKENGAARDRENLALLGSLLE